MTAKKDARRPKANKPKLEKETVKDLAPKDDVKGGAVPTHGCVVQPEHASPHLGLTS